MKVNTETMKIQREKMDLVMHYTNPLWIFCRLYKVVGRKCATWIALGGYNKAWRRVFKNRI